MNKIKTMLALLAALICGGAWAIEPVAKWENNLADGATAGKNNKYTMSKTDGNTNVAFANGRAVATATSTAHHGIIVSWPDPSTDTDVIQSEEMTVFVKYNGYTGSQNHALFAAQWEATDKETVVYSNGAHTRLGIAKAVTSSGYGDQNTCASDIDIPTDGIMMISMGNSTGDHSGVRVAIAPLLTGGNYGPFVQKHYRDAVKYAQKFKGIKIAGTIGSNSHFYRGGMTVTGVSIYDQAMTLAEATSTLKEMSDSSFYYHKAVVTDQFVSTGWTVGSIDELLNWNFAAEMIGGSVGDKPRAARGFIPVKNADGTVKIEFQASDNQTKGVGTLFKIGEDGTVHVKGVGACYFTRGDGATCQMCNTDGTPYGPGSTTIARTLATAYNEGDYGVQNISATPKYMISNALSAHSKANYTNLALTFNLPNVAGYPTGAKVRVKTVGIATEGANNDLPEKIAINGIKSSSRSGKMADPSIIDGTTNVGRMIYYTFDEGVVLTVGTAATSFGFFGANDSAVTSVRFEVAGVTGDTGKKISAITIDNNNTWAPVCTVVGDLVGLPNVSVGFNGDCWTTSSVLSDGSTGRTKANTIDNGDQATGTDAAANFEAVRYSTTDKAVKISNTIRPVYEDANNGYFNGVVKKDASWTVSIVTKPKAVANKKIAIWGMGGPTWNNGKGIALLVGTDGKPEFISYNGGTPTTLVAVPQGSDFASLYDDAFHVITISYNHAATADRWTMYVDGARIAGSGSAAVLTEMGAMFVLGNVYGGATSISNTALAIDTLIDDVAAWNRSLGADEVAAVAALYPKWPRVVTATVSSNVNWSEIAWSDPLADENSAYILTVENGATITIDKKVSLGALTINGAATIVAADTFFVDGCYSTTILTTKGSLTAENLTFAEIKDGFSGAYTKETNAITLRAQNKEVISINIAGGNGGGAGGDSPNDNLVSGEGLYGLAPVPGSSWNNINRQWQNGGNQTITINGPNAYTGTETVQRGTMSLSATGKNTWQAGVDNPFLRGYLDDGNGVTVEVTGIPYTTYDVIIYATSDATANILAPITVNGTQYTFVDGATKPGNSDWGVALQATPVLGKNAIMVKGQNLQTLTISSSRTSKGRGTLCAVQVINMGGAVLTRQEFTSTIENTVNEITLSELTDDTSSQTIVAGELNELTIHANGTAEDAELVVTIDDEFKLALLKVEGDRPVKLVTGNDFANITTLTLTTSTAIRYTNDLSAGTVPNRGARTYEYANATINAFINGSNAKIHVQNGDTLNITARTAPSLVIEDGATVTIGGAVGSLWYGDGTTYVQKGGTVTSAINGTGTSGTGSGLLLGYQNTGITQMAISGGTFTIENSSINFHSCSAMTVSGTGHVKAKGVFKSNGSVTPTVTISESGIFEIGSLGWSGATLTMNGGTFKAYETSIMSAPMTINSASTIEVPEGVTLTITGAVSGTANITKTGAGNLVISGSLENYTGMISASAGHVSASDYSKVETSETGKLLVVEPVAEYAAGHLTVPTGLESVDFDVLRPTGVVVTKAEALADTEAKISGIVTSFDVTYTNTLRQAYSNVSGFSSNSDGNNTCTYNITPYDAARATEIGAYLKHQPHLKGLDANNGFYASTDVLTFAIVGTMPTTENTIFAHFGHSNSDRYGLLLITGTKKDDVLVAYNHGSTVTPITTMSVPNASTARHVYIVTKEDDRVNDSTTFTVYLDGQKWKTLEIKPRFMIIGNVQLGGDFWGLIRHDNIPENPYEICKEGTGGIVNCVRGYNRIISAAEIAKYSEVYHYSSPNGASERTFEATADWIDTTEGSTVWTNTPEEGEATQSGTPLAGAAIVANLTEDTTITVNVPADGLAYESFNIKGAGSVTFEKGEDSGSIRSTGMVTIGRPVTVKPGSFDLSTPPITLLEDGDLTFDYSDFDVSEIYVTTKINLTGQIDQNDAKVHFTAPTSLPYRTAEMAYDTTIKQYVMTITPNHQKGDKVWVKDGNTYSQFVLEDGATETGLFPTDKIVISAVGFEGNTRWDVNLAKDELEGHLVVVDYPNGGNNPGISVNSDIKDGLNVEIAEGSKMYVQNGYSAFASTISGEGMFSVGNTLYLHKTLTVTCDAETTGSGNFCLESDSILKVPAESSVKVTAYSGNQGYVKKTAADNVDTYTFVAGTQEIAPAEGEDAEPVVIEDVGTGIIVNPGAEVEVKLPENATQEQLTTIAGKISVKYTIPGTGTVKDLKADGLVTVAVNSTTGAIELTTTDSAKPAATEIAMSTPTEGEGEEATDKVQFTITNPIPGLFYEIVSGDSFDEHGALVVDEEAEKGTSQATTSAEAKTVSIPMTFTGDKKVKYYKVSVKATK